MIYIYYCYLNKTIHDELLKKFLGGFSIDYQERISKFRRWQDVQLSLIGRLLLFYGMAELKIEKTNNDINYTKYNKPFFADTDMKFNISHSGNLVVCAISEKIDIGIDIELMNNISIEDFKNQMTNYEWTEIKNKPCNKNAFYEYWTQKEAVLKAYGRGLLVPLKSFEVKDNTVKIHNDTFLTTKIKVDSQYKMFLAYKVDSNVLDHTYIETNNPLCTNYIQRNQIHLFEKKATYLLRNIRLR